MIRRLVDKWSAVACLVVLLGFAYAGLSPFRTPPNGAKWLVGKNGMRIRGEGILRTDRSFTSEGFASRGCSIELWLQSARNLGSSTILDFYQTKPLRQFVIRQDGDSRLQVIKSDPSGLQVLELDYQFFPAERTLLTITSGPRGAVVFVGEKAMKTSGSLEILPSDCTGTLVLGAAAVSYNNWNGELYGVAIYNSNLTEVQVRRDYEEWHTQGQLNLDPAESVSGLYEFSERSGNVAHNRIMGGPDLIAPPAFQIPGRPFLENPWSEFRSYGVDWKDVVINIVGFIPFGFFLLSFLTSTRDYRLAGLSAVAIGLLVSLAIEVLQWHLPTRGSSMFDVTTNTLGTAMGALTYRVLFGTSRVSS